MRRPIGPQLRHRCLMVVLVAAAGCGASSIARKHQTTGTGELIQSISDSVSWITVNGDSGLMRAAVARPTGQGPFPAVIILHGTHGFAQEYVKLASDLARQGVLSIAACWFEGGGGLGERFMNPIPCNGAPRFVDAAGTARFKLSRQTLDALANSVKMMPDARGVALFGHSRGGGAALDYALRRPGAVVAIVLNSTGYPLEVTNASPTLNVPVLMMHGTADSPADGGSAFTNVEMARRFESALRTGGKYVETKYYEGGGHNSMFSSSAQYEDAVQRISTFLHRVMPK